MPTNKTEVVPIPRSKQDDAADRNSVLSHYLKNCPKDVQNIKLVGDRKEWQVTCRAAGDD